MESTCTVDSLLFLRFPLPTRNGSYTNNETDFDIHQNASTSWRDFDPILDEKIIIVEENFNVNSIPKTGEMAYWLVAAIGLILIRRVVERNFLKPLGISLGIKEKNRPVANIPCRDPSAVQSLDQAYFSSSKQVSNQKIFELSKQTGLSQREVERWLRKRRALDKPSTLIKFSESGWRFICYVISASFGYAVLRNKPWFMSIEECFKDHPHQTNSEDVWWYHFYGGTLYTSFLMTQAFDVKRKDFWEMLIHHVISITLLALSWSYNLSRIGMVTLLLHDCADVFIELAKMANYSKRDGLATGIFVVFTLVWVVTRLIIFPLVIINSTSKGFKLIDPHVKNGIVGMGIFLCGLHLFWTYFILKVAKAALFSEEAKDSRSCTESGSDSEKEMEEKSNIKNGHSELTKEIPFSKHGAERRHSIQYENLVFDEIEAKKRAFIKKISSEWT
ncbi:unnamed protein product [Orchesella dallaii]|uniref:TLC domain-containing protein n=1 Tax=Orchesella dallaii TaxID=48710 RepID=A0ABP1RWZ0_9HEXA